MTEQKAIEVIKYASAFNSDNSPLTKALDIANDALEEIQQYRTIGTVEEFKALKEKNEPKNNRCDCGGFISRFDNNRCLSCGALHAIRN